jgi:hypothetical protein
MSIGIAYHARIPVHPLSSAQTRFPASASEQSLSDFRASKRSLCACFPLSGLGVWGGLAVGLATVAVLMIARWLTRDAIMVTDAPGKP